MKPLLKTLTETFSPSGYEDEIRKVITKEVKPLADEVRVDALGNLIVRKKPAKGAKDPKKIMIAAHMDEIGVMVTHVDSNGFVRFLVHNHGLTPVETGGLVLRILEIETYRCFALLGLPLAHRTTPVIRNAERSPASATAAVSITDRPLASTS